MASSKDRANRARWSRDQKVKADAAMAEQFQQDDAAKIEGLRRMLATCEIDPACEAMFGARVRAQLASVS